MQYSQYSSSGHSPISWSNISQDSQYFLGGGNLRSFVGSLGAASESEHCNGQSSVSCASNNSQMSQYILGAGCFFLLRNSKLIPFLKKKKEKQLNTELILAFKKYSLRNISRQSFQI